MVTIAHFAQYNRLRFAPGDNATIAIARATDLAHPLAIKVKRDLYFPPDQLIVSYMNKTPKAGEVVLAKVKSTGHMGAFVQIQGIAGEIFVRESSLELKEEDMVVVRVVKGGEDPFLDICDLFKKIETAQLISECEDNYHATVSVEVTTFPKAIATGTNWRHIPTCLLAESTRQLFVAEGVVMRHGPQLRLVDLRFLGRFEGDWNGRREEVGEFCDLEFLRIAPEIIKAIASGRIFTAEKVFERFVLQPRGEFSNRTHSCLPIVGQGLVVDGVDYRPNGLLYVPKNEETQVRSKIESGGFQFKLTIEGFSPSWTVWDLILAMHDRQLFVVPADDSMPAPKVAVLKTRLNTDAWVATTEDGAMVYLPDSLSAKGCNYNRGERVAVIDTGAMMFDRKGDKNIPVYCSIEFFPIAELLLAAIRGKREFTASDYRNLWIEDGEMVACTFFTDQRLAKSCQDYNLTGKGFVLGESGNINSKVRDRIASGKFRFTFEMVGLNNSWTTWDLIRALAQSPLSVIPTEQPMLFLAGQ